MSDLIDRQAAIDAIKCAIWDKYTAKDAIDAVCNVPSAERKRGRWELAEDGWYCSSCELYPPFDCDPEEKGIPFCPYCGAEMRGEEG